MAEHITKSCHKLFFFTRTSISRNDNFPFFSCSKEKKHVWMTSIKIITKFWEVFSWFKENKNVINISSVKNWFKFFWALFKPWYFIKTQENTFHSWSERQSHGHAIFLLIKNITKYEMPFLSSQRQKVLKFIYALYNILIIIKQIRTYINGLFKRYINKQWANIKAAREKITLLMYNFFSKSKRIF